MIELATELKKQLDITRQKIEVDTVLPQENKAMLIEQINQIEKSIAEGNNETILKCIETLNNLMK